VFRGRPCCLGRGSHPASTQHNDVASAQRCRLGCCQLLRHNPQLPMRAPGQHAQHGFNPGGTGNATCIQSAHPRDQPLPFQKCGASGERALPARPVLSPYAVQPCVKQAAITHTGPLFPASCPGDGGGNSPVRLRVSATLSHAGLYGTLCAKPVGHAAALLGRPSMPAPARAPSRLGSPCGGPTGAGVQLPSCMNGPRNPGTLPHPPRRSPDPPSPIDNGDPLPP
jgi:hypothetical protein